MKTIDRIIEFHEYLKAEKGYGGRNVLERSIGKSEGYLSNALKKKSDVSNDVVTAIIERFPIINPTWLLTGEGEMLKSDKNKSNITPIVEGNYMMVEYADLRAGAGTKKGTSNIATSKVSFDIPIILPSEDVKEPTKIISQKGLWML